MLSSDEKSAHAAIAYILTFQHVNICFFGLENFTAALLHSAFLASVSSDSAEYRIQYKFSSLFQVKWTKCLPQNKNDLPVS